MTNPDNLLFSSNPLDWLSYFAAGLEPPTTKDVHSHWHGTCGSGLVLPSAAPWIGIGILLVFGYLGYDYQLDQPITPNNNDDNNNNTVIIIWNTPLPATRDPKCLDPVWWVKRLERGLICSFWTLRSHLCSFDRGSPFQGSTPSIKQSEHLLSWCIDSSLDILTYSFGIFWVDAKPPSSRTYPLVN